MLNVDIISSDYRFLSARIDSESLDSPEIQMNNLKLEFEKNLDILEATLK